MCNQKDHVYIYYSALLLIAPISIYRLEKHFEDGILTACMFTATVYTLLAIYYNFRNLKKIKSIIGLLIAPFLSLGISSAIAMAQILASAWLFVRLFKIKEFLF